MVLRLPTMDFAADMAESIAALRENEPPEGYYGLFSGGKDSVVLKHVAKMADVRVTWHYNVTTIDPPELIRFMRQHHPDVIWHRPPKGPFFRRAAEVKGFPTRRTRWCCEEYKENTNPEGVTLLMGIRGEESAARAKNWDIVSNHFNRVSKRETPSVNPLYRWPTEDLWKFIRGEGVPYCSLYDEGFHRLGCIGCPFAGRDGKRREFDRWPRFEERWQYVFKRTWERRTGTTQRDGRPWFGDAFFRNWQEMWEWWLSDRSLPERIAEGDDG